MRNSYGALIGFLVAGLFILSGCAGRAYSNPCPCGFTWSSSANGCTVDIWNLNPCPPQGGPPSASGGSSGGGNTGGGVAPPPISTGGCALLANLCDFTADFREGRFYLSFFDGSPVAGKKVQVKIVAREQSSGKACTEILGIVAFPSGTKQMSIPVDASTAVATYPGLKGNTKENCVSSQFTISVAPEGSPECGCVFTAFKR